MTDLAVEARAFAALDARLDPASPAPLAVAVSGGGDSVALLALIVRWARDKPRRLHVLHLDHGLNAYSVAWADSVRAQAHRSNAGFTLLHWAGPKPTTGLPAAARATRHALLAQAAREVGARVILMGHTADDAAEAEWMRARGVPLGRVRAWAPSPAWPEGRDLMLLRPLLDVGRAELRAWLTVQGLDWIEDSANADLRFTRSRARAAGPLRPVPPAKTFPGRSDLLEWVADAGQGLLRLDRGRLRGAPGPDVSTLLSAALLCAAGTTCPPRGAALLALLDRVSGPGPISATLAGARLESQGEFLLAGRDPGRSGLPTMVAGGGAVWDGRLELPPGLSGRVRPLTGVAARLSPADREAVRRTPAVYRPTLPVLETDGHVRPAPGRWLAFSRLQAAMGAVRSEADLA